MRRAPLFAVLAVALASGTVWCATAAERGTVVARETTPFSTVTVYDDGPWRCLRFGEDDGLVQSCMHREDDRLVRFEYVRMMFAGTLVVAAPRRILLLGLGGASLPKLLRRAYPDAELDIVELDPGVVALARAHFRFVPDERTHVFTEDAEAFVRRAAAGARYDLVLVDCFDATYIPPHLQTEAFVRELAAVLADGGAVLANIFSGHPAYDALLATYGAVFAQRSVLAGRGAGNHIVVASRAPTFASAEELTQRAAALGEARAPAFEIARELGKLRPLVAKGP